MTRNVIVTGSAQGIGFAIAQAFDKEQDRVFIFDMNQEAADKAASELNNGVAYKVDITNEDEVSQAIEDVNNKYGAIDG